MKKLLKIFAVLLLCAALAFGAWKYFAPNAEDSDNSESAVPSQSLIFGGNTDDAEATASPLNLMAESATVTSVYGGSYDINDTATLNELDELLSPIYDAKKAPQVNSEFNICFYRGDECISMDVYIDEDAVFADMGNGPYLVAGTTAEVSEIIK